MKVHYSSYGKELEDRFLQKFKAHSNSIAYRKGSKSDSLFKTRPKIPKSGKSLYRGLYLRKLGGLHYIYDVEKVLLVKVLDGDLDVNQWVDNNYLEIRRRIDAIPNDMGI